MAETEMLASRDRNETETFKLQDETETKHLQVWRRDRDVEMHTVINAVVNKLM